MTCTKHTSGAQAPLAGPCAGSGFSACPVCTLQGPLRPGYFHSGGGQDPAGQLSGDWR
jgi:hypothetical protein